MVWQPERLDEWESIPMATCDYCSTTIIFGGKKEGDLLFCNDKCLEKGFVLVVANEIPADMLDEAVAEVHQGLCPICGGPGPIDVQTSYTIWSAIFLSSWKSNPDICYRSCGTKKKSAGFSSRASSAGGVLLGNPPHTRPDYAKFDWTFFSAFCGQAVEGTAESFEGRDGCGHHGSGRCNSGRGWE